MLMQTLCELAKLAEHVQLHVMKIDGDQFQVVIQPKSKLAEKHKALSQPLMVTECAARIEGEVVKALTQYTPMLEQAGNNLQQIQAELEAAQKTARDKASAKKPGAAASPTKGATQGAITSNGVKPAAPMQKTSPPAPDLFGDFGEENPGGVPPVDDSDPGAGLDDMADELPDLPGFEG